MDHKLKIKFFRKKLYASFQDEISDNFRGSFFNLFEDYDEGVWSWNQVLETLGNREGCAFPLGTIHEPGLF